MTPEEGERAALYCFEYLKPGGYLRIAVPDGFHPDPDYIDWVKINGVGPGSDDHKVLYNYKMLSNMFEKIGFKVNLLEYFDLEGKFHFTEWDATKGKIHRSMRYDERNTNGALMYTSIILDAYKNV